MNDLIHEALSVENFLSPTLQKELKWDNRRLLN